MSDWIWRNATHPDTLRLVFFCGVLGLVLHTLLYGRIVSFGKKLLKLEVVREARMRNHSLDRCCRFYENGAHRMWFRLIGLTQSLILVIAALAGLVWL